MSRVWIAIWGSLFAQLIFILFLFSKAHAADVAAGKLVETEGASTRFVASDGREAILKQSQPKIMSYRIQMQLLESNCPMSKPLPKIQCEYHGQFWTTYTVFKWTQHFDPKLVGEPLGAYRDLQKSGPNREYDLFRPVASNIPSLLRTKIPNTLGLNEPDSIDCNSTDWIPQGAIDESGRLRLKTWWNEFMFANRETGVNENRPINSIENSIWVKTNSKLFLENFATSEGFFLVPPAFQHNVMIFELQNADEKECQIDWDGSIQEVEQAQDPQYSEINQDANPILRARNSPNFAISNYLTPQKYYPVERLR
ncbi:MAG TPA: hypothetical protein PLU50_00775 [Pseudobdellovibrionaceae bacterium]|nr:hypothetical protein [Pseudobdellovibrionaceae bacterium]